MLQAISEDKNGKAKNTILNKKQQIYKTMSFSFSQPNNNLTAFVSR